MSQEVQQCKLLLLDLPAQQMNEPATVAVPLSILGAELSETEKAVHPDEIAQSRWKTLIAAAGAAAFTAIAFSLPRGKIILAAGASSRAFHSFYYGTCILRGCSKSFCETLKLY